MEGISVNNRASAYIAIILAAILWGTPYIVVKIGLSVLSPPLTPLGYLMLRFSITLLFLFPLFLNKNTRDDIFILLKNKFIVFLGLINGIAYTLQFLGQVGTTAALATLMVNTYLISTPILSSYFLGVEVTKKLKLAILGGMIGSLIASWSVSIDVAPENMIFFIICTFLVLLSGLIWGAYAIVSNIINKKAAEEGIIEMNNPPAVFTSSNFYSVLVIGILMFALGQTPRIESVTKEAWLAIIYLALFCTIIPFILYIYANQTIQATKLNIILLLNIIVGLIVANLVLSEILTIFGILGSFLIILSIYLASSNLKLNSSAEK